MGIWFELLIIKLMKIKNLYSPLSIGIFIILLKLLIIDIDPPNSYTVYYPIDELYYSQIGVDFYKYNELLNKEDLPAWGLPYVTNFFTYIGLVIFGNNYTGLRFSSLLFGIVSLVFFYLILKRITQNTMLRYLGVLLLAFSFPFTMSNIFLEPTIARTAVMCGVIFLTVKWYDKTYTKIYNLIILTFTVVLLWLITYPTNAFTVLALFIVALFKEHKYLQNKQFLKILYKVVLPMFIGFVVAMSVYVVVSLSVFDEMGFLHRTGDYTDRVAFGLKAMFFNVFKIGYANIFLFNPILVFASLISFFTIFFRVLKKRKLKNEFIIAAIYLFSFLTQTLFINDAAQRKLIIMLPLVLLVIIQGFEYFFKSSENEPAGSIKKTFPLWQKLTIVITVVFMALYAWVLNKNEQSFHPISWIFTVLFIISVIFLKYKKLKHTENKYLILIIPILLSVFNIYNSCLSIITKNHKTASMSLAQEEKVNYIGGLSMGFNLYNDNNMCLNPYFYYGRTNEFIRKIDSIAKSNNVVDYLIAYEKDTITYKQIGFEKYKLLIEKGDLEFYGDNLFIFKEVQ